MGLAEFHRRGPDTYSVPDDGAFVVDREVLPLADFADGLPATSGFIGQAGHTWLLGGGFYTHFYAAAPPNSAVPDCAAGTNNGIGLFTARSYHPGGVNAAMADGSARWFTSTTDTRLWRSHGTRNRGD